MGITIKMTVAEAWDRRRRYHRDGMLNQIEAELYEKGRHRSEEMDIVTWKGKGDVFRPSFSTKDTWNCTRSPTLRVAWHKGVWFAHATPKYSFCVWLAAHNRLSTGDRMIQWKGKSQVACVLCNHSLETREHLFFSCPYATELWHSLAKGIFRNKYSTSWQLVLDFISNPQRNRVEDFLLRYVFQAAIYSIWQERNGRRHGKAPTTVTHLIRWTEKQVRNKISSIRQLGDRRYDESLQLWFRSQAQASNQSP